MVLGYVEVDNLVAGSVVAEIKVSVPSGATADEITAIETLVTTDSSTLLSGSSQIEYEGVPVAGGGDGDGGGNANAAGAATAKATYAAGAAVIAVLAFMA